MKSKNVQSLNLEDIMSFKRLYRANLINSISGYKSANLIGSKSKDGISNLAVFSSVVHIGSDPPLLSMITRPTTVPRHSYDNLKETGFYTINHITTDIVEQAHQCSAKYEREISEFEKTGLTEEYIDDFPAPFVKEAGLKIAMQFEQEIPLEINGTIMIIGRVMGIHFPSQALEEDGSINLNNLNTVAISGLDTYHNVSKLMKLSYARP